MKIIKESVPNVGKIKKSVAEALLSEFKIGSNPDPREEGSKLLTVGTAIGDAVHFGIQEALNQIFDSEDLTSQNYPKVFNRLAEVIIATIEHDRPRAGRS